MITTKFASGSWTSRHASPRRPSSHCGEPCANARGNPFRAAGPAVRYRICNRAVSPLRKRRLSPFVRLRFGGNNGIGRSEAPAGHLSRAVLERYSRIGMDAKRQAVESMSLKPKVKPGPQVPPQVELEPAICPRKTALNF
jgi:hypothetical protein